METADFQDHEEQLGTKETLFDRTGSLPIQSAREVWRLDSELLLPIYPLSVCT